MSYESEPKRRFDDGESVVKAMSEGPYKLKDGIEFDGNDFIFVESEIEVDIANAAYAAGRKSRDGLRKAATDVMAAMDVRRYKTRRELFDRVNPALESLDKALADDEKGEK